MENLFSRMKKEMFYGHERESPGPRNSVGRWRSTSNGTTTSESWRGPAPAQRLLPTGTMPPSLVVLWSIKVQRERFTTKKGARFSSRLLELRTWKSRKIESLRPLAKRKETKKSRLLGTLMDNSDILLRIGTMIVNGGGGKNRTLDNGFGDRCYTT